MRKKKEPEVWGMWYKSEIIRMLKEINDWKLIRMIYTVAKFAYEKTGKRMS